MNATARVPNINSFRDGETMLSGGGGLANTTYFVDPENAIVAVALAQYFGPGQDNLEMALRTSLYGAVLD